MNVFTTIQPWNPNLTKESTLRMERQADGYCEYFITTGCYLVKFPLFARQQKFTNTP